MASWKFQLSTFTRQPPGCTQNKPDAIILTLFQIQIYYSYILKFNNLNREGKDTRRSRDSQFQLVFCFLFVLFPVRNSSGGRRGCGGGKTEKNQAHALEFQLVFCFLFLAGLVLISLPLLSSGCKLQGVQYSELVLYHLRDSQGICGSFQSINCEVQVHEPIELIKSKALNHSYSSNKNAPDLSNLY